MVRYLGNRVEEEEAPGGMEVDSDSTLSQLRFGMMMIFKQRRANKGVASHLVGEIGMCDLGTKTIKIHHYIDLGSSGELKDYKPRKALKNRQLFPEHEDANAQSYTMPKAGMSLKPDLSNLVLEYPISEIEVIVKNFKRNEKNVIPSDVIMKYNEWTVRQH